jgi:hypothetical protein
MGEVGRLQELLLRARILMRRWPIGGYPGFTWADSFYFRKSKFAMHPA